MKQSVPFLDLVGLHRPYLGRFVELTEQVVGNASFVGGEPVTAFEKDFAAYCENKHAVGVANGTDAIELALEGLGIGPGDEVITAANTFFATIEAIEHAGATPVLVDCDSETWLIDPEAVKAAITPKTSAIIAVHLYGQPAPMEELKEIAENNGLVLVEDSAQAHGARLNGIRTGSLGHAAAFSFYPGKNLGACGDGGGVVTGNASVAEKIRVLSQHGQPEKYLHRVVGYNSRLDTLQALFLKEKLENLDRDNDCRRAAAEFYNRALSALDGNLQRPVERENAHSVYHLYVVHVADREALLSRLAHRGVNCAIHYPVPCHLQEACEHLGYREGQFPNAEFNAAHCLSLPIFPTITKSQLEFVAEMVIDEVKSEPALVSSAA